MTRRIVALTGAGISRASGLPTYAEKPELRALFQRNSFDLTFHQEYIRLYDMIRAAEPNDAHTSLADYSVPVITQNIDDLHEQAGSINVLHLHGIYNQFRCLPCDWEGPVGYYPGMGCCPKCGDYVRPAVVMYGEDPRGFNRALDRIAWTDVLLVIGCSLEVYPAAQLPHLAIRNGKEVITINNNAEERVREVLRILRG